MSRLIHALNRLQPLLFALALLLMLWALYQQSDELASDSWRLDGGWLLLAILCLLLSWAIEVMIWRGLLNMLSGRSIPIPSITIPYASAVRIWFLSAIMRYIPGNIWQPMSMAIYCQRWQVAPENAVTSVLLYQLINFFAVAPIALLYLGWSGNWGLFSPFLQNYAGWLLGFVTLPVIFFFARPNWLIACCNIFLRRFGRNELPAQLQSRDLLWWLGVAIIDWLCWGVTFACLTYALHPFSWQEIDNLLPHLVAANAIAYAVGFVSLITPSGIGVREGALYVLLSPLLGGGLATLSAVAMRILITLGELVAASVAYGYEHWLKK